MNKQMLLPRPSREQGPQTSNGWKAEVPRRRALSYSRGDPLACFNSLLFRDPTSGAPQWCPGWLTSRCCSSSTGHGNFPYLCGNLNDVVVSPLLHTCYQSSQSISRAHEQYGASTIQPISEETQLLLTVYYLVQLGESPRCL